MRAGCVLAAMIALAPAAVLADEPGTTQGTAKTVPAAGVRTDAAARPGVAVPPGIAVRGVERRRCREQAAKLKLFGLGRHKFLQRCRAAARRKGAEGLPPR